MEMVWHYNEFMQEVPTLPVMKKHFQKKPRPALMLKKTLAPPGLGSHEVSLIVVCSVLSSRLHFPSGAKAQKFIWTDTARLKPCPFKAISHFFHSSISFMKSPNR